MDWLKPCAWNTFFLGNCFLCPLTPSAFALTSSFQEDSPRPAVLNLLGSRDWSRERQFFHRMGWEGWFGDDSSTLRLLCTLLSHQLHLRSSGIRSQRLETLALGHLILNCNIPIPLSYFIFFVALTHTWHSVSFIFMEVTNILTSTFAIVHYYISSDKTILAVQ